MKAEDAIAKAKHTKEMQTILETPLDPNLDYFDATGAIKAITEHVRGLHRLIEFLSQSMIAQGASLIAQRQQIIELKADLAAAGIERADADQQALVGIEQPGLVGFDKKRN